MSTPESKTATLEEDGEDIVFCFDRDLTVAIGHSVDNRKPHERLVNLDFVRHLAHETPHEVWATGNQMLVNEANIPGVEEAHEALREEYGEKLVRRKYGRARQEFVSWPARDDRIRMVKELHPDADRYIVIDDANLSHLAHEGIEHYRAWEFIALVEQGRLGLDIEDHPPVTTMEPPEPGEATYRKRSGYFD